MARKTKEEALKTREAIINAAIQLFADLGIFSTTLANIAEKAGVTRGAIYHHFKNKEDLLDCLKNQFLLPFEPAIRLTEDPEHQDLPDVLSAMEKAHIAFFKSLKEDPRQLQLHQILTNSSEEVKKDGVLHSKSANNCLDGLQKIENLLCTVAKKGQLHENFNARLGSIAISSFSSGLVNTWVTAPSVLDIEMDAPALFNGLSQMLRSGFICTEEKE